MTKPLERKVMLDGAIVGTGLESTVMLDSSEVDIVRKLLIEYGGEEQGNNVEATVHGRSGMVLSLRQHYHQKNSFYLNLSGNPLTFIKGDNTYGYAEADRLIVAVYRKCMEAVETDIKFPQRLKDAIANRDINVHSLEFACYMNPVVNKTRLLNDWAHVYTTGHSSEKIGKETVHTTLQDILNLKFTREHKDHKSSVCLKILDATGYENIAMLMAYDKAKKIRSLGATVPDDIKKRIRLDLHLNYGWFRRRQVDGDKLKTLRDLSVYIEKKHEGDWVKFLAAEYKWALDRTCLFHMWSFDAMAVLDKDTSKLKKLPIQAYNAMLKARALLTATDADWIEFNAKRDIQMLVNRIELDPHPELLTLDMGLK